MEDKINALMIACKLCDISIDEEQAELIIRLYEELFDKKQTTTIEDIGKIRSSIRQKYRLNRKTTMPL